MRAIILFLMLAIVVGLGPPVKAGTVDFDGTVFSPEPAMLQVSEHISATEIFAPATMPCVIQDHGGISLTAESSVLENSVLFENISLGFLNTGKITGAPACNKLNNFGATRMTIRFMRRHIFKLC